METDTNPRPHWISIGRNVGDRPMNDDAWWSFQLAVHRMIGRCGVPNDRIVTYVHGDSSWEGGPEETYLVLVSLELAEAANLATELAHLAYFYRQEAIGLVGTYGPPSGLVEATS